MSWLGWVGLGIRLIQIGMETKSGLVSGLVLMLRWGGVEIEKVKEGRGGIQGQDIRTYTSSSCLRYPFTFIPCCFVR